MLWVAQLHTLGVIFYSIVIAALAIDASPSCRKSMTIPTGGLNCRQNLPLERHVFSEGGNMFC
jgi:hypothetical protein